MMYELVEGHKLRNYCKTDDDCKVKGRGWICGCNKDICKVCVAKNESSSPQTVFVGS